MDKRINNLKVIKSKHFVYFSSIRVSLGLIHLHYMKRRHNSLYANVTIMLDRKSHLATSSLYISTNFYVNISSLLLVWIYILLIKENLTNKNSNRYVLKKTLVVNYAVYFLYIGICFLNIFFVFSLTPIVGESLNYLRYAILHFYVQTVQR